MTKLRLLSTAALTAAFMAGAATAQTTPPAPASDTVYKDAETPPTEVVVTATRRGEKVLNVPYNITAVQGKDIEQGQVQNNAELLRSVPGIAQVDRGPRNQGSATNIQMRGVNVDSSALGDYWVPTVAPVSTYVNDTPLFANFALIDIDRVEVLRGPQGTLYGSGSLGGTVRYISNKPQFDSYSGRASVTASQGDGAGGLGYTADLVLNVPLGSKAAMRINLVDQDYPGTINYVNLYKLDSKGVPVVPSSIFASDGVYEEKKHADTAKIQYGRVAIRYQPTDTIDLNLTLAHQQDKIGGRRQVTTGVDGFGNPYGKYDNGAVLLEPSDRTVDLAALEASIDFGFATLTSSTSYYDHTGSSVSDNSGFYANDTAFHNFYYNYPRPAVPAYRSYGDRGMIEELRLVSNAGKKLDWVAGAYVSNNTYTQEQDDYVLGFQTYINAYFGLPADSTVVAQDDHQFTYHVKQHVTDAAVFGELTYHVSDTIQITGGLRHFHTFQDTDVLIDFPIYTAVSSPDHPPLIKQGNEKTLFRFNASWKYADNQLAYATASQGYRRGGVNMISTTGRWAEDARWRTYKPDMVINYELGFKGRLNGLSYNAAAYYIDWTDIQLNSFSDNFGFFAVANGKRARSAGFEGQLDGYVARKLHYSLGYTYTNAKLTSDFISPTGVLLASDGEVLPGTPQNAVTVAADYTKLLSNGDRLFFRLSGYYQSTTRNALGAPPSQDPATFATNIGSFDIWNATSTWSFGQWDASLFVKNIFNVQAVSGEFTQAYMGTNPGFPTVGNPDAANFYGNDARLFITTPRTIGIALNRRW